MVDPQPKDAVRHSTTVPMEAPTAAGYEAALAEARRRGAPPDAFVVPLDAGRPTHGVADTLDVAWLTIPKAPAGWLRRLIRRG